MSRVRVSILPTVLWLLLGPAAGCTLVMDADFDKYEAKGAGGVAGAGGTAGVGGTGGIAGQAGAVGGQAGEGGTGGCDSFVLINEIQTAGSGGPSDEFVELVNVSECVAVLEEFELIYRSSKVTTNHMVTWTGDAGQVLEPWHVFVIAGPEFIGGSDSVFPPSLTLGANGGGLSLRRLGEVQDQVGWGDAENGFVDVAPAPAPAENQAIGRYPDGVDTDNNAVDFILTTPSPGGANPPS